MKEWITGRNPIYETLLARRRQPFRLRVAEGAEIKGRLAEILKLCESKRLPVERIPRSHLHRLSESHQGVALEVSAYSLVAMARRAAPLMKEGGSIVTLTYYGAEKVVKNYNVMGVAKAALEASVRYLAADLGPEGIRVNAVSAGAIKTLSAKGIRGFNEMLNVYAERTPLRRNVDPQEVGSASVFLLSDAARGVTGEVLHVDSGYHVLGM